MDEETAMDAADEERKRRKENLPERLEEEIVPPTPGQLQEAREAAEHFDRKVEEARKAGAYGEEVEQVDLRGFEITLKFKIPWITTTHQTAYELADAIAAAIHAEAMQIDDSWDHSVDVQGWRR